MSEFFVNPWMLGGLSLLAAPIIIHLLNKRRFVVVEWAAMEFLFQAESRSRRRLRLEDLLLLLLRMLLVALIVFMVARPVLQNYIGSHEDARTVVLDDSFSMEASDGTGSPFAAAKGAAVNQVEEAVGSGMTFSVWSAGRGAQLSLVEAPDREETPGRETGRRSAA